MKKISYFLPFILLFATLAFVSCDDEQLTGEFFSTPDGSDPEVFCSETGLIAITEAQLTLALLDPADMQAGCDALIGTINSFINTCGDEGGGLQLLLDELGTDCNLMVMNDCDSATIAAELLEDQFNNATTQDDIDSFCVLYGQALNIQIEECGDSDGAIQAVIDALPCT